MEKKLRVALVAHDNMKRDLAEWVDWNWEILLQHHLICTGTTGKMVAQTLMDRRGRVNTPVSTSRCSKVVRWEGISSWDR